MQVVVVTKIRLLGDGIASCLRRRSEIESVELVNDIHELNEYLKETPADVVLVDVSQGMEQMDIGSTAVKWPDLPVVALGLTESLEEVLKCGRSGFAGYISNETTIDGLYQALSEIAAGRVACPPEITSGLLRALFRNQNEKPAKQQLNGQRPLTRRETEVLELIGQGFTNKEIGKELNVSVSTVKHHVHYVLQKMGAAKRTEVMRRVREEPWLCEGNVIKR